MPGYDDPRYLQKTIEDLQKRVATLEGNTMPLAVHQKGPLPGMMRAVTLGDTGLGSSMWLNLNGNIPGVAPYQAVTDASKVVRAEWGNLAANGISPAQFGFRANAADGSPIFDSLGLINVMKILGTAVGTPGTLGSATTDTLITGSAITFTLSRAQNVMLVLNATANSANQTGFISAYLDNATYVENYLQWGFGGPTTSSAVSYSSNMSAGPHTVDLRYRVSAGAPAGSLFCNGFLMQCYLLGT